MFLRLLICLCPLFLASCGHFLRKPNNSGQVTHAVFLWLKEPGSAAQRQRVLEAGNSLKSIPGLLSLEQGVCIPSQRPIVDSTYDVGFVMTFPDQAALDAYLVHPQHVKAATEVLKPLAKRLQVYDFLQNSAPK